MWGDERGLGNGGRLSALQSCYRRRSRPWARARYSPDLLADQRTASVLDRTKRLVAWDFGEQLVIVPWGVALLGKQFTRLDVEFRLLEAVERICAT
jgi:hypothetical protein